MPLSPRPLPHPRIVNKVPSVRLPCRRIDLLKHAARALFHANHGECGQQALHAGVARQGVVREVGPNGVLEPRPVRARAQGPCPGGDGVRCYAVGRSRLWTPW